MLPAFVESSIDAYEHTYVIDLTPLQLPFRQSLVAGAAAVVVLVLLVRHFTLRSLALTIFWGGLGSFWGAVGLCHSGGLLAGMGEAGHVLELFQVQIRPLEYSLLIAAYLGFAALAALYLTRSAGQRVPSWRMPVGLLLLGVMGWAGSAGVQALHAVALIGHVPVLEFVNLHPVQVGYPFAVVPTGGLWAGLETSIPSFDCDSMFHVRREPKRLTIRDLSSWKLPKEPYVAEQTGDNVATYRMVHGGSIRFSVMTRFHVKAEPETGNPLLSLRVGDTWTYRRVTGVRSKQVLLREFAKGIPVSSKNDNVVIEPVPFVIKVERATVLDGMRVFEIQVGTQNRFLASMWSGETYLMKDQHLRVDRTTWIPILNTTGPAAGGSKSLYPCGLSMVSFDGECVCNSAPMDVNRPLLGLAYCIERHSGLLLESSFRSP